MIQLNNLVTDIKQIDPIWTFSHYCNIPAEQFNGSNIKIKSVFKPDEKTPSLSFYCKDGQYKFNCFSTSKKGDHINLVQEMFNSDYSQSCFRIMNDYTKWTIEGKEITNQIVVTVKFKVTGYVVRLWNTVDKNFFLPFDIGTSRLEWGLVKPLSRYKMSNQQTELVIEDSNLYGYFTRAGELYKIYQPNRTGCKFISVNTSYEVGSDHKEGNKFYAILSSWKDAMSFKGLGLNVDIKVPTSESAYFSKEYMKKLKREYKGGFTLLDTDEPGKKAMLHYKKEFGINYVWLPLSKDYSDSIRDFGKQKVRSMVIPLIHKALNY